VAAGAVIGAVVNYSAQVYSNYQSNGGNLGAALTTNIDLAAIGKSALAGAAVGLTVAVAAPVAIAAAGDALAGTGLLLGSTELFGAGMAAYGAATTVENALLGVSTEVVANETTALRTSNEIAAWGEQQVGEQLPVQIQQVRIPGGERVYDGYFMDNPQAYVEIKTSTRGVVYATQSIRNQIAFDSNMGTDSGVPPTWIFVNARPSTPLMQLMRENRIPWHQLYVPWE